MIIKNIFNHLNTIRKHRYAVMKLCFKCGLYWQGLVHDLSKYSLTEFIPQIKYWTGKKSPIDLEIEDKGYSMAWLHHKGRNKHHWEYWLDLAHCNEPVKIPEKYVIEMFCDKVGASKAYNGQNYRCNMPYDYVNDKCPIEKANMNKESHELLMHYLELLKNTGNEKDVCFDIKQRLKNLTRR